MFAYAPRQHYRRSIMKLSNLPKLIGMALVTSIAITLLSFARDDKGKESKTFTVSKGGTLEVSVNIGAVHIKTWDKNEVTVQVSGEDDEEDHPNLRIRQKENVIRVENDTHYGRDEYGREMSRFTDSWATRTISVNMPPQFTVHLDPS